MSHGALKQNSDISGTAQAAARYLNASRVNIRITALAFVFVAVFVISFSVGRFYVPVKDVVLILLSKVIKIEPTWTTQMEIVVINVRLPRIIAAAFIGMALSVSGCVYQGMFRNPMVSPDILGSSAGAGFGAALSIFWGLSSLSVTMFSFAFGALAVFMACFAASKYRSNPTLGLVLTGIMIGSLFTAATSFIKLVADPTDQLPVITYWLMGSLSAIRTSSLLLLCPIVIIGMLPLLLMRWRLNVITLGEEEARSLGVNTKVLRFVVIVCATLMSSACVAVSGLIGWVGLVIPHFSRKMVGCDYKSLLPGAIFMGGAFMIAVDDVSRTLATNEIPIGILTAFIGAPFFLYMILKEGKKSV